MRRLASTEVEDGFGRPGSRPWRSRVAAVLLAASTTFHFC
jgi:hypothetical protein